MRNRLRLALPLFCASLIVGCAAPAQESPDLSMPDDTQDLSTPDEMPKFSTPDGAVFLTIDLRVDPEKIDEFLALMVEAAPDTRAWDGCRLFDIYVDEDEPGHVVFYEIWDSKEQQEAYVAWRQESGFNARIGPYMVEGGGGLTYFKKIDG